MTHRFAPLVAASLALAALTLLYPSSPTYDPWAWIVWGREVMHLDLNTVDGPSWKPLPVFFTTALSIFGGAAPALWLVVARAGAIAAIALAFDLARRLGGTTAGAAAAGGLLIAPWFVRNAMLGNSEGLMVAAVLATLTCHLSAKSRQAFAWAVVAALMRPEAWPFLGLYALWLLRSEGRAVLGLLVVGLGSLPLLWFVPELLGSGNLMRAADRAQQPLSNSAAFADHAAIHVLHDATGLMTIPAWLGVAAAIALVIGRRVDRRRALPVLGIAALALLWTAEVAIMTEGGFSGNLRYLIVPAALGIVVGAIGVGWLLEPLTAKGRGVALVAGGLALAVFALPSVRGLDDLERDMRYQGKLPHLLADAIDDAGGAARLRACGAPYTGAFLVPAVAWRLGVHTSAVGVLPRAPAVVFRVRTDRGTHPVPTLRGIGRVPQHTLGEADNWRIVGTC